MTAFPYDLKFTIASGANAGAYGFMLAKPAGQGKQLSIDEVGGPEVQRLSTDAIATHADFAPEKDAVFAMSSFRGGIGQVQFDLQDESSYWWGQGVVTHVDGKAFLARAVSNLALTSATGAITNFLTYVSSAGTRYDFCWEAARLYRRDASNTTNAWTLVWTQANAKPITSFIVHNGIGIIACETLTDAIAADFYTQADVTAAATWAPTARNHTPFTDAAGRPKILLGQRATCYAAVDNAKLFYTVDPTQDGWVGPIEVTVGSLSAPMMGDTSYEFTGLIAVNDYLFAFKPVAGYAVDSEQNVTEALWQWIAKPSAENFRYFAAGGDLLVYSVGPEVYAYDPASGANMALKIARQSGYSVRQIVGLGADNQYVYVLAKVRVPSIRSAEGYALLRGFREGGSKWAFECLWEDSAPGTTTYQTLFVSPDGVGSRVYWGKTASSVTSVNHMDIPADWDESTGSGASTFQTSGVLYTSITWAGFPGLSKRHLWLTMQTEGTTSATYKVAIAYSTDNGASWTALGDTGSGGAGTLSTKLDFSAVNAKSIALRFTLTGDGAATPILRVFDEHQRARFRYLHAIGAGLRIGDYIEMLNGKQGTKTAVTLRGDLAKLRAEDGNILYEDFIGHSFNVSFDKVAYQPTNHEKPASSGELSASVFASEAAAGT